MLTASYSRAQKGEKGKTPELISATYGEIPDKLWMGEMALAMMTMAHMRGDTWAAEMLGNAIDAARRDGVLETLP